MIPRIGPSRGPKAVSCQAARAMTNVVLALAGGVALSVAVPAWAAESAQLPVAAARVADWIAASRDNASLHYIIVDKKSASLFLK